MTSRLAAGLVVLFGGCIHAHALEPIWSNAWYAIGQPGLTWDAATAVRTTDGEIVTVSFIYGWGPQVTSMTPEGAVNWQINLGICSMTATRPPRVRVGRCSSEHQDR
jgi:hypothetical protein